MKLFKNILKNLLFIIVITGVVILIFNEKIPKIENENSYIRQVEQKVKEMMNTYNISGVQIATFNKDETKHMSFGFKDIENQTIITNNTIFRAQSLSKTITSVLILKLVQEGVVNLDDTLEEILDFSFLNKIPSIYKDVTIDEILKHQGHMPLGDFNRMYDINEEDIMSLEDALIYDLSKPRDSSSFFYSNVGYNLLAYIINEVEFEGYEAYAKEIIFEPLKMDDTSFAYEDINIDRFAYGYDQFDRKVLHYQYPELGSGGLLTTASDFTKFLVALAQEELISEDYLDLMLNYDENVSLGSYGLAFDGYGYGVFIENQDEDLTFAHGGQGLGFMAFFHMNLEDQTGYVVMSNSQRTYPLISSLSTMFHDNYQYKTPGIKNIHLLMTIFKVLLSLSIYLVGFIGYEVYKKRYIRNKIILSITILFIVGLGFGIQHFYFRNYIFIHVLIPLDFERLIVLISFLEIILVIYLMQSLIQLIKHNK